MIFGMKPIVFWFKMIQVSYPDKHQIIWYKHSPANVQLSL